MKRTRSFLFAFAVTLSGCAQHRPADKPPTPGSTQAGASAPGAAPSLASRIDETLAAAWTKAGITPAPIVDDARFLRRATLDLTGTLPTPDAIKRFLADTSPDKRARAVDELLASPRYADRWTDYWSAVLMGSFARDAVVDRLGFREWLHNQFATNASWSSIAAALVTATGINRPTEDDDHEDVNGAVNYLVQYSKTPQDLSGNVSRVFLGVQIQCAQCHDHKTEKWTQADFRSMTAIFAKTRAKPLGDELMANKKRIEVRDVARALQGVGKNPDLRAIALAPPRALDGTDFSNADSPREAFAAWMTSPQNPWFARALVNRLWSELFGRGFVEPIDDFRPSNPPVLPELLDRIAQDFSASGYDMKRLLRALCTTKAYQLAAAGGPSAAKSAPEALWSRHPLEPLSPEVLLTSIIDATHLDPVLERVAGGNVEQLKERLRRQFGFLFDVDDDAPNDAFQGTISQAMMQLNGLLVNGGASEIPGTALTDILASGGSDADKISELYLRTLSRKPTDAELEQWTRFVNEPRDPTPLRPGLFGGPRGGKKGQGGKNAKNGGKKGVGEPLARFNARIPTVARTAKDQAYEDLFWALLNSSEFFFNH